MFVLYTSIIYLPTWLAEINCPSTCTFILTFQVLCNYSGLDYPMKYIHVTISMVCEEFCIFPSRPMDSQL